MFPKGNNDTESNTPEEGNRKRAMGEFSRQMVGESVGRNQAP